MPLKKPRATRNAGADKNSKTSVEIIQTSLTYIVTSQKVWTRHICLTYTSVGITQSAMKFWLKISYGQNSKF